MTTSTSFAQMANNQSISLSSALRANTPPTKGQTTSRKFLTLSIFFLLSFFCTTHAWGADVTISVSGDTWTSTGTSGSGSETSITKDGITVSSDKGYKDGTTAIREYSGGIITVSSSSNITKIVFTSTANKDSKYGPNCIALKSGSAGTYSTSSNSKLGTWTGTAKSITFTCSAQFRWTQVVVTIADAHTVTWTINPAAGGTLSATSGNSTTVSPNAAYTYGASAYTVTSGAATVLQSGNTFTATPTANSTIQINMVEKPKYTVTLEAGPGTCDASVTEISAGAGVTLPTPTLSSACQSEGWSFAGWKTTSAVATETTTKPTLIAAGTYKPTSNINLYAVYQRTETTQGGGSGNYELVTSAPDDWSGTYLIVDGTSKNCFDGSLAVLDAGGNYKSVTISNNTITSNTTTDSYSVTISKSATNGKYYIKTASGYYIGSNATSSSQNNELDASTSTKYDNSISISSNNVTIEGPDHILKFFYQSGQSWRFRFYKSSTTQNVRLPQLYKKSAGGSSSTTYYHSTPECADPCDALQAPNVTATATANSITLSWAAVPGATSYNIYNYTTEETDETTNLTYTFNGLDPETEYEWEVEAVSATCNGKGTVGTTTTQKACTDAVKVNKGTPSNGSFTMVSGYQSTCNGPVTVTLSDIEPATGYQFSAITQSGVDAAKVTIDNIVKTVTYAKNTTGTSTINVEFTPAVYTIIYKDQGGANFSGQHEAGYPQKHTYNAATTLLSASKEHYTFDGWYKESDCSGTPVTTLEATEYTENITLYAKWTAKTYTITFNAGNGTCTTGSATTTNVGGVTLPTATHTCPDWTFAGWWTEEVSSTNTSPGTLLNAGDTYNPTSDITLYAVYSTQEAGDAFTGYAKVTTAPDDWSGKYLLSTGTYTANGTYDSNGANGHLVRETYTPGNEEKAEWEFTLAKVGNTGYSILFPDGSYYLGYASSTNFARSITVVQSDNVAYLWSPSTSGITNVKEQNRKIQDGGGDFRPYAQNETVVYLYKRVGGGTTTTYNSNPTCLVPVWNGADIDKTALTVNCGERSSMDGAAKITFSKDKIFGFSNPITIEASEGFWVSTSRTPNENYQRSVSQRPLVGTDYPNTFNDKFVYVRAEAPAQSDTDLEGTITIKNSKGETLQTFSITADVTCTTYTLTLDDRGTKTTAEYYAGASVPKPADPEGVCTDPINYVFDGWSLDPVIDENTTSYEKVTFPFDMPAEKETLYAVYRYTEGNTDSDKFMSVDKEIGELVNGMDYVLTGYNTDDKEYALSCTQYESGKYKTKQIDVSESTTMYDEENPYYELTTTDNEIIWTITGDDENGYSFQNKSTGKYLNIKDGSLALNNDEPTKYTIEHYVEYDSESGKYVQYLDVIIQPSDDAFNYLSSYYKNSTAGVLFNLHSSSTLQLYLYKRAAATLYTTSPACGPMLEITSGKDIYVTSGFGTGRNTVIAQQTVEYRATRLKTQNGSAGGKAPDVKVAANGITIGREVTDKVKVVELTQNKELIGDKYTITGTVTVQYTPTANNLQEEIQVQLAVDYNSEAKDNFTVHARSLPAEFVIAAKQGDKWYALNADMSGSDAEKANGYLQVDNIEDPTKATFAPCNTIYTFDGMVDGGNKEYMRFQGIDGKYLWAASEGNTGIQNYAKNTPAGDNKAYNWKLYTEDNITYRFGNANSSRQLTLSGEKFGMYASGVQDIRILPYEAKCIYNYAPTNLKVSVLKSTSVTLTWEAVPSATKYQYSTDATNWTDAGTEPTATITDLTGNKKYTYYVRAYHEDAGVSQECIDYAEITFTTANCDDVPTNITYTADLNSITVSWTAAAPTATITYNTKEDGTGGGGTIENATSPRTISGGLNPNTTYYIQIFAGGTCASPIIPVKTEDVELDIVEWDTDKIFVDINTNEIVSVTLENEVSYGSGSGKKADELFFSKYFEGSGSLKLLAIYNGTGKDIDLSTYRIDRGVNGNGTKVGKSYVLSQLGTIKNGQEIIFYSWPLPASGDKEAEYSYECSRPFLESKANESGVDANPRWILCDTEEHDGVEFETMDFSGDDPLLLYKGNTLIDVFGVSTAAERPSSKGICSGRSDNCWSATGVSNMDYGKTEADFEDGIIPEGVDLLNPTITAYTARVIMFRKNTVVSGNDAVTKNETDFVTFADEWEARQVCMVGDDGDLTCAAYQELGTFDYSKYYTKFESMGDDQEFDANKRNSDGTLTILIPKLNKQSCRNIKITVKDANGNVLKSQDYKVPIMITTDQETAYTDADKAQNAFYALQENLATVEVDSNGNPTGNKTNLTLEQVREICKTCDVVVRNNAILTKVTDGTTNDHPQVRNVYVYEGASIVIPDGENHNYTINGLSLRRKGDVVASAQVQGTGKFVLPADEPVCLDLRVDANNWHWFTLPFDCLIEDVTWVDGTPAKYNTDWFLMYYDGESRAASTNPYDNHWKVYNGTTIEAGKGYIVGITGDLAHPSYTFELRFPMAQGVLTAEQTRKTVPVNAWGVKSDNKPNNLGWNLVGNPYLNYYKTADEYSLAGLPLIKYTSSDLVVGEFYEEENGNIPFLVTPIDGGWYEYRQELASEVNMMPFTAYFVQVGDPKTHTNGQALDASFEASNRGKKSIVRRAPREVEEIEEPIIVRVELTNSKGESDKTSLVIDDRFTNEYEMNADFFKWFGDYYNYYTKPVLYTIGADQGKRAFNALNEELAKQPIPMGMYAAQAGNYTFSLNQQFDLSRVEEVWLYDATQSTYTNLMQSDYTFSTSKVNGAGRFSLSVKLAPKVATSIDNVTADKVWATTHTKQVIVNGLENGMHLWLYDATGKLLYTEPTSNYQHTYAVPQTGTYFVSVMNGNAKQTIKVVVE